MVKKLSEKQFTNTSDDTFTVYFNYNLLDYMENAVYMYSVVVLTWVQNFEFEQRCHYKLKSVWHKETLRF